MARRKASTDKRPTPPPAPVEVRRPHPLAWGTALRLAGDDPKRLSVDADGSVWVR